MNLNIAGYYQIPATQVTPSNAYIAMHKEMLLAGRQKVTPVILATWATESGRIVV
jgi:hypothetical protein